jgi:hypothetical protein
MARVTLGGPPHHGQHLELESVMGVPSGVSRPSLKVGVQVNVTFTQVCLSPKKPNSDIREGAELATVMSCLELKKN